MFPELYKRIPTDIHAWKVFAARSQHPSVRYARSRISGSGHRGLDDMDRGGVAVQVLSMASAVNSTYLRGDDTQAGVQLAREINDAMKTAVDTDPKRFKAFAELPFHEPQEATKELHRCVKELGFVGAMLSGSVSGDRTFLNAPEYDAVLSAFEELDIPLYLHPGVPPQDVWNTYYKFDGNPLLSAAFGLAR